MKNLLRFASTWGIHQAIIRFLKIICEGSNLLTSPLRLLRESASPWLAALFYPII
jgi:hypothetical protein